jgi:hypothetical protein
LSINTDGGGEGRGGGGGERSGGGHRRRFALNAGAAGGQLQGAVAAQLGPPVILHDDTALKLQNEYRIREELFSVTLWI